jgi:hypothetical protein
MPDIRTSGMARIFCQVLERQAYLFAECMDADAFGAEPGAWLRASLRFGGDTPGVLRIVAGEAMAREGAANLLGTSLEDPSVEAHHREALGRSLNRVCGHMLTALHGEHALQELGVPVLEDITWMEAESMAGTPGCLAFLVEDHPVLLCAEFHGLAEGQGEGRAR